MALQEILLTFYLLTGNPKITKAPIHPTPFREPAKQEEQYKELEKAIISENEYDFSQRQNKIYKA